MKRRSLLKNIIAIGGAGILSPESIAAFEGKNETLLKLDGSPDWGLVKKQFDIQENLVYFNNGTIGPNPRSVIAAISDHMNKMAINLDYYFWKRSIEPIADFVGVAKNTIALTANTTAGNNIVAQGVRLKRGDEIITTSHEHVGNAMPWLNRARAEKVKVRVIDPANTVEGVLKQIDALITRKTKVIAVPHISCTIGQVFPIPEIAELINGRDIFLAVDGAHGPGSSALDISKLKCDSYASNCHKWMMGSYGTGFLYVAENRLEEMSVAFAGVGAQYEWQLEEGKLGNFKSKSLSAERFTYGTQNTALSKGNLAAIKFVSEIGTANIENRIAVLQNKLRSGILERSDKLKLISPTEPASCGPMLSFVPLTMDFLELVPKLRGKDFKLRTLREAKLNAIRVSTHVYNNEEQLDAFFDALDEIL